LFSNAKLFSLSNYILGKIKERTRRKREEEEGKGRGSLVHHHKGYNSSFPSLLSSVCSIFICFLWYARLLRTGSMILFIGSRLHVRKICVNRLGRIYSLI